VYIDYVRRSRSSSCRLLCPINCQTYITLHRLLFYCLFKLSPLLHRYCTLSPLLLWHFNPLLQRLTPLLLQYCGSQSITIKYIPKALFTVNFIAEDSKLKGVIDLSNRFQTSLGFYNFSQSILSNLKPVARIRANWFGDGLVERTRMADGEAISLRKYVALPVS